MKGNDNCRITGKLGAGQVRVVVVILLAAVMAGVGVGVGLLHGELCEGHLAHKPFVSSLSNRAPASDPADSLVVR